MSIYQKGKIVRAIVTGIEKYGVFVSLDEYYSGLIHISEISKGYVKDVTDYLNVGDVIDVKILEADDELFQLKLSIKDINCHKCKNIRRKTIKETPLGFKTLAEMLPLWIKESLGKKG